MTQAHMDIVDVALVSVEEVAERSRSTGQSLGEALSLPKGYHKRIKLKANNYRQITNHARARNAELVIQMLYTYFTEYLRSILHEMYDKKPLEIVDKAHSSLKFHEIVQFGSYDAICNYMVDYVFRSLESQRSTQGLLEKILEKTDVKVDSSILQPAIMYMEMRHLYVHNSGVVDVKFERNFGALVSDKAGRKFNSSIGRSRAAIKAIERLCSEVDKGLTAKGYLTPTSQTAIETEPETAEEVSVLKSNDESSLIA
ncbi:hypothetical protein H6F90_09145 [Trichocoleus sp. FACHB-591]|nr:hypothetical protein [Trichocoleus sp. FACHB-591]